MRAYNHARRNEKSNSGFRRIYAYFCVLCSFLLFLFGQLHLHLTAPSSQSLNNLEKLAIGSPQHHLVNKGKRSFKVRGGAAELIAAASKRSGNHESTVGVLRRKAKDDNVGGLDMSHISNTG